MAQYTLNISPGTGTIATSDQAGMALCLQDGDSLLAQVTSSFAQPAIITAVNFYANSMEGAGGTLFAVFSTNSTVSTQINYQAPGSPPPSPFTLFTAQASADRTSVTLTDAEGDLASDQHIWYTITVVDGNGTVWTLDPEVINTGGGGTRVGFVAPTQADTTQTLPTQSGAMPEVVTRIAKPPAYRH